MKSARPFYHEFAWAYDLLQTEPIAARVEFIEAILSRNGIAAGSKVLDAGCGTGHYAVELAKRGFKVCGVDRSPELIAVARNREVTAANLPAFVIADLQQLSFARPFDVILCRGVLNDFIVDAGRGSIFRQFAMWLRPGGILIFDVREWTGTFARYTKNSLYRRTVELPNSVLHFQSETVLDDRSRRLLLRERFDMERAGERTSTENDFAMRAWTLEEIAVCVQAAGLEEIATYPTYGETDRAWSDRVVIIARKNPF